MSSHQLPYSSSSPSLTPLDCRPIFHQIPSDPAPPIHDVPTSGGIGSRTRSPPPVTLTPEEKEKVLNDLYKSIMKGDWDSVVDFYLEHKEIVQTAKIKSFNQTALHLAIFASRADVVKVLLDIVDDHVIRDMIDHINENPLHLAASLGQTGTCKLLVNKDPELIGAQNIDGETPLFIAARNGKKGAFYALHPKCPITGEDIKHEIRHCKRNDGNTILHVSILGEYFELAYQIIYWYPELGESRNQKGHTALHLLAQNPAAFKSWCDMGVVEDFIYRCLNVDFPEFEEPSDFKEERRSKVTSPIRRNCKICLYSLITAWKKVINAIVNMAWEWKGIAGNKDVEKQKLPVQSTMDTLRLGNDKRQAMDDPNPENKVEEQSMDCHRDHINASDLIGRMWSSGLYFRLPFQSDSWAFYRYCVPILQFTIEHLLRVLGLGFVRVTSIKKKKQKHTFAAQVLIMLFCYASDADRRSNPPTFDKDLVTDKNDQSSEDKEDQSTPFLIAAKMGVLEIVQGIMLLHPMAIHQEDVNKKNALLLAVEHKHQKIYKLLLQKFSSLHSVVEKVDKNGNTALHLAATLGKKQQWGISSAAIQMQWEIKWYNFIKSSMPTNLRPVRNYEGRTSKEVFDETHEGMIKDGVQWLKSTSESCSVVAALIASVAYASAATLPGGYKGDSGIPILKGDPSFDTFIIASLVALCFSVTSLTMFLSILTTNYTIQDFLVKLPTKLLLGHTSLFISIGAMLVSFCAGHFFNIGDRNRNTGSAVFAIICLPLSAFVLTQFHLLMSLVKTHF